MTEHEPDPRTDGVGDGGPNELPLPTEREIHAGVAHDQAHRNRIIAEHEKLTAVKMRQVDEEMDVW
jgi:hypothetical protein